MTASDPHEVLAAAGRPARRGLIARAMRSFDRNPDGTIDTHRIPMNGGNVCAALTDVATAAQFKPKLTCASGSNTRRRPARQRDDGALRWRGTGAEFLVKDGPPSLSP